MIDLSKAEIQIIAEDMESFLASMHRGDPDECEDLAKCPLDHFSLDEDPGKSEREIEILMRQALLIKLDPWLRRAI